MSKSIVDSSALYVLAGTGNIYRWDINTCQWKIIFSDMKQGISNFDISRDEKRLAYSTNDTLIIVIDLETNKILKTVKKYDKYSSQLKFNHDASILAFSNTGSYAGIYLLNVNKDNKIDTIERNSNVYTQNLIFSSDDRTLAFSQLDYLYQGKFIKAFTKDSNNQWSEILLMYEYRDDPHKTVIKYFDKFDIIGFKKNNKFNFYTADSLKLIKTVDVSQITIDYIFDYEVYDGAKKMLCLLIGNNSEIIINIDLENMKEINRSSPVNNNDIKYFDEKKREMIIGMIKYNIDDFSMIEELNGHFLFQNFSFVDGMNCFLVKIDSKISLVDYNQGNILKQLPYQSGVYLSDVSHDKSSFCSISENSISLYDLGDFKLKKSIQISDDTLLTSYLNCASFNIQSNKFACSFEQHRSYSNKDYNNIYILKLDDLSLLKILKTDDDFIENISFSPDDKFLIESAYNNIPLINIGTGDTTNFINSLNLSNFIKVLFTPDGKSIIAVTKSGIILILDPKTMKVLSSLDVHFEISDFTISDDNKYLAVSSFGNKILIYDLNTMQVIDKKILDSAVKIFKLKFNANHSQLAFLTIRSTIYIYNMPNLVNVQDNSEKIAEPLLSPNPASDFIEITYPPLETGLGGVRIYNVLGEIQTTPSLRDTPPLQGGEKIRIDISGLSPGMYFVRIGDKVSKFVKL